MDCLSDEISWCNLYDISQFIFVISHISLHIFYV